MNGVFVLILLEKLFGFCFFVIAIVMIVVLVNEASAFDISRIEHFNNQKIIDF